MGLDTSDSVALTALIVSLIALLIALFQFLQASAITADGWRQCGPASLGGWSIFREWNWHWSEWRYEVFYTVPEIVTLNGGNICFESKMAIEQHVKRADDVEVNKNHDLDENIVTSVFDPTCTIDYPDESDLSRQAHHVLGFKTLPPHTQEQWIGKGMRPHDRQTFKKRLPQWLRRRRFFRETDFSTATDLTSWGRLIGNLYHHQKETLHLNAEQLLHDQTFIAIQLRQESWDFLPADVARPPARIRLGTLLLLARRIGMVWKSIEMSKREYIAERSDGQPCILYSSDVRSLGTVFHFEAFSKRTLWQPRQTLCSTTADKMCFSIIPGCQELGIDDIAVTGRGQVIDWEKVLQRMGLSKTVQRVRTEYEYWMKIIYTDMLAFFAPFIPLEGCPVVRIIHPCPPEITSHGRFLSFFSTWQIRAMLYAKLDTGPEFSGRSDLLKLFSALHAGKLEDSTAGAMNRIWCNQDPPYLHFVKDMQHRTLSKEQKNDILDVTSVLRAVHQRTTKWFVDLQSRINGGNEPENEDSFYMELVRAHINLVAHSIILVKDEARTHQIDVDVFKQYGRSVWKDKPKMTAMCELWPDLLDAPHEEGGIKRLRRKSGGKLTVDNLREAWWYLMVRAISWRMSVEIELPEYMGSTPCLMPSDLYQDRSLVWLL